MDFTSKQYGANLTPSQQQAMLRLAEWYTSKEPIITLSGAAGMGKTFLVNTFLNKIATKATCVTAPTHKAVRIIEKMTHKKGMTIHSLHGLRPDVSLEDFSLNDMKYSLIGKSKIGSFHMIIPDEASQLNNNIVNLNETRAKQFNTKILYVGDKLQLPPIKERISSVFTKYPQIELTDMVRQDIDNPLGIVLPMLRHDIQNRDNTFIRYIAKHKINLNSKGEGYEVLDLKAFQAATTYYFSEDSFTKNLDFVRYTAYHNNNIELWNNTIRLATNHNPSTSEDIINEDDMFTSYKTIVDEYLTPIIINSEDYIVDDVRRYMNEYDLEVFIVAFKNANTGEVSRSIQVINHKNTNTFKMYYRILKDLLITATYSHAHEKGANWKAFYDFKNAHLSMVSFDILDDDNDRIGFIQKDIDYGFGITVHKSQGSTYENVFVNVKNINKIITNKNPSTEMRNRLLYVALSRSSKKAMLLC